MSVKVIAELSANHKHDINIAKQTITAARVSGADAVKLQTYTPDTLTIDCDNDYFMLKDTIWAGRSLYNLYEEAYTPWEWHKELFEHAESIGLELFSTPFDKTAVDLLEELNTQTFKIASFEIVDIPLLEYTASKGKPMILSTGIATLEEIKEAITTCRINGCNDITLLQCTSQYPAKPEDANLRTMIDMKDRFGVEIGLSDHSMGHEVAVTAVAMGATIIEKHFILDRSNGGPDASFSMTPFEFEQMVMSIRKTEKIMGSVTYEMTEDKRKSRMFARSLFIVEDVKKGDVVTERNVRSIRPGDGISPKFFYDILGKRFVQDIGRGTPLSWKSIE